ncbi:hypothetical protein PWT90_04689 [Aphanocladium album]|nr:hypothetical protein PWT90_04689 [Aphanocladium album]
MLRLFAAHGSDLGSDSHYTLVNDDPYAAFPFGLYPGSKRSLFSHKLILQTRICFFSLPLLLFFETSEKALWCFTLRIIPLLLIFPTEPSFQATQHSLPSEMQKLPAETLLQIAGLCSSRRDLAALVATCRHLYFNLDAVPYKQEFYAICVNYFGERPAICTAARNPECIGALEKWLAYISSRHSGSADIERKNLHLGAALEEAATTGNKAALAALLDNGAPKNGQAGCDVLHKDPRRSALLAACRQGDSATEIVEMILNREFSGYGYMNMYRAEETAVENLSLIQEAAAVGSVRLLRLFQDRGHNLCSPYTTIASYLPMCRAILRRHYVTLDFLLREGLYPQWESRLGMDLLTQLGCSATVKSMSLFLAYTRISVNTHHGQGGSVFSNVLRHRENPKVVQFLISKGANVNQPDEEGTSALTAVILRRKIHTSKWIDLLIEAGVDINQCFKTIGRAILHCTIRRLPLLIKAGVIMSMRGPQGMTPLMVASQSQGGNKYAKMILESGVDDVDARNNDQESALKIAVTQGEAKTVQLLLEYGADPNQFEASGASLLSLAAQCRNPKRLFLLINAGADVNVLDQNDEGKSPLIHAVIHGRRLCAQLLLEYGATIELRDKNGNAVQDYLTRHTPSAAIRRAFKKQRGIRR